MTKSLEQRVVAALTAEPAPSPAELLTLIAALETGIAEANTAAETADKKFLDPVESPDVNKARALMESTQFVADRLRALLPRVQAKYRAAEHEAVKAGMGSRFPPLGRRTQRLGGRVAPDLPGNRRRVGLPVCSHRRPRPSALGAAPVTPLWRKGAVVEC